MEVLWTFLIETLRELCPWVVVDADERGVRSVFGRCLKELHPGLYLTLPAIEKVSLVNVTEQTVDVRPQTLTTSDMVGVGCSVTVTYRIANPVRYEYEVVDADESLCVELLGLVDNHISRHTFAENQQPDPLENAVLTWLRKFANRRWGIEVINVRRADFGRGHTLRIMGIGEVAAQVDQ